MRKRVVGLALRVVAVLVTGAFVVWGVRWREVVESLRNVDGLLLVLVVAANAGKIAVKAVRLRLLIGSRRASFGFCFLALLTSSAINNVAPLRGGDVARLWMFSRNAAMTKAAAIGVTAVERLVDIFSLAAVVMVVSFFFPTQRWAGYAAPIVLAGGALLLAALWLTAGRRVRMGRAELGSPEPGGGLASRLRALGERFAPGVKALRERGVLVRVLALSLLDWGCEGVMVVLCARSLGVPIGLALAPVILLGINLAIALPAAPASTGPFEGATVVVLTLAGVASGPALAFALVYHAVQVVPVTLAGLAMVSHLGITLSGQPAPSLAE
ncbi:MAG: lysylphosphatidylglycerol synthase transmembrane domain-containing protein [Polyangia bacterium]